MSNKFNKYRPTTPILERERRDGRLGIAEYGAARIFRSILERLEPSSLVSLPGEDAASRFSNHDIISAMTDADMAREHKRMVAAEIGTDDALILEHVLVDDLTFREIAEARGYGINPRGVARAGDEFRRACHDLALFYGSQKAESLKSRQEDNHA